MKDASSFRSMSYMRRVCVEGKKGVKKLWIECRGEERSLGRSKSQSQQAAP